MSRLRLTGAQLGALRKLVEAPLGLVRVSAGFHGTADGESRVRTASLSGLERAGLAEWRTGCYGTRCFPTDRGRELVEDQERASAVIEAQGDLFAQGGAA